MLVVAGARIPSSGSPLTPSTNLWQRNAQQPPASKLGSRPAVSESVLLRMINLPRNRQIWRVYVALGSKTALVKWFPAKVFAEAEAVRLRLQYRDERAEFWFSATELRTNVLWNKLRPSLRTDGAKREIFDRSSKRAADRRVCNAVLRAIKDKVARRRRMAEFTFLPYTVAELMAHIATQFKRYSGANRTECFAGAGPSQQNLKLYV